MKREEAADAGAVRGVQPRALRGLDDEIKGGAVPDRMAFAGHCNSRPGVAFPHPGQDAILVVPSPVSSGDGYGHLASFVRQAPATQQHAFWKLIGQTMIER